MKALSIRQPWAWLIVHGPKRVENRCRPDGRPPSMWKHRGPIAIHTSKTMTRDEYEAGVAAAAFARMKKRVSLPPQPALVLGAVIGVADVTGCLLPFETGFAAVLEEQHSEWWDTAQYGLLLDGVRPVTPIPCAGALGLWSLPTDVERQLREQLGSEEK